MEHYKERDEESTVSRIGSNLTVNGEKLKDSTYVANAYSNFFITNTEKIKRWTNEKGEAISILKDIFLGNFPAWK